MPRTGTDKKVQEPRHTYIYGIFADNGPTALTPEYLYYTVFPSHDNDEFNVVRVGENDYRTWSFRIKCATQQRKSHFKTLIETAGRLALVEINTYERNNRSERMKHEKNFFAYPGERMLFGGQYGAPGARAKAAAAAASDARDAAAAAAGFEENSDQSETEPDSETECSPASGAPPPKRARITGASPAAAPSVSQAYLQSEVEHARTEADRVRKEAKARETEYKAEAERQRKEAEAREAEWKAETKRQREEYKAEAERQRKEAEAREAEWKAETKRAREEMERQRNESKEEIARLRAEVEKARDEADRVRAEFEAFRVERAAHAANSGGNKRRVQIVLDHVKAHFDKCLVPSKPPAEFGMCGDVMSGVFMVKHCESLLREWQPDLQNIGVRARDVFALVTCSRIMPPGGERGKQHGVHVFFGDGAVAFYNGAEKSGVRWERNNAAGWRAAVRV